MPLDSIIFNNKWLSIKKCANHEYFYAERLGVDSIAFILQDRNTGKFGLISEFKPPIQRFVVSAFGGSLDNLAATTRDIVIQEVKEEAGYVVSDANIFFQGVRFVSTQMNQWCYLYLVDVTGLTPGEREPQNSIEALADIVWLTLSEIAHSSFMDWKAQSIAISTMQELRNADVD